MERRTVLKGLVWSFGGAIFSTLGQNLLDEIYAYKNNSEWLDNLEEYSFESKDGKKAARYSGNIVNMPFLWQQSPEIRQRFIEKAAPMASHARIFISDCFEESSLGNFNDNIFFQVDNFGRQLTRKDLGLMVDMIDGYTLRNTWNGVYGSNKATSVYSADGEDQFYGSTKYQEAFLRRIDRIGKRIKTIPNLTAVSVGNELRPPELKNGVDIFLRWYERMTGAIKNVLPGVAVLSGVADPRVISRPIAGLDANTIHLYQFGVNGGGLANLIAKNPLPIVVQEFGVPEYYLGINYHFDLDNDWQNYLRKILAIGSTVDNKRKTVRLNITGLGVWKMDAYNDGHNFDPDKMPKTAQTMRILNTIFKGE